WSCWTGSYAVALQRVAEAERLSGNGDGGGQGDTGRGNLVSRPAIERTTFPGHDALRAVSRMAGLRPARCGRVSCDHGVSTTRVVRPHVTSAAGGRSVRLRTLRKGPRSKVDASSGVTWISPSDRSPSYRTPCSCPGSSGSYRMSDGASWIPCGPMPVV